jgi:serine/threonine protein kinase
MPATPEPNRIGTVLSGAYQVERLIGEGGMGQVFAAIHLPSGHRVAIKILRGRFLRDRGIIDRFLREAQAVTMCAHPHVVQLLDTGYAEDGLPFMVLTYLEGETLVDLLYRKGRFKELEAVQLLTPIIAALEATHRAGVVHRDLKPDNIYLARNLGVAQYPVLMDYGIAGLLSDPNDSLTWNNGSLLVGTPAYMAPEQAAGTGSVDPRADIYSMGVLLYELLTGSSPFQRESEQATIDAILQEAVRSPSKIVPSISPAMEAVILCAMGRSPEHRFVSMNVFGAALHDALQQPMGSPALRQYPLAERVIASRIAPPAPAPMPGGPVVRGAEFADKRSRTVMIVLDQQGGASVASAPSSQALPGQALPAAAGGGSRVGLIVAAVLVGGAALGAVLFIAMQYLHR